MAFRFDACGILKMKKPAMMQSGVRTKFSMRFFFAVGGEIMVGKPEWLKRLEEEQVAQSLRL
jgi:hypothetical protein